MRREGDFWHAYYDFTHKGGPETLLGAIRISAIEKDPDRMAAFFLMMQDVVSDLIFEQTGVRPQWTSFRPEPEDKRGGSA